MLDASAFFVVRVQQIMCTAIDWDEMNRNQKEATRNGIFWGISFVEFIVIHLDCFIAPLTFELWHHLYDSNPTEYYKNVKMPKEISYGKL